MSKYVKVTVRDEGQSKIFTITWTIDNFRNLLDSNTKREIRVSKCGDDDKDGMFQLKMKFYGLHNSLIEIYFLSSISVFCKAILTLCLKRFEERSIVIREYHTASANKWQFLAALLKRDIIEDDNLYLLGDGSIRLKFQFYVNCNVKVEYSNIPEAQLSSDFENLLNNGLYSDIIIKSVEGIEYKVHKAVLASRSVVLKAHFEHNTTECFTNVIVSHLESEVLREVLTFIYSDKAPQVDEIPEKLLAAADYYQLKRLKSLCEDALHKKLTIENAIETLQLADLHTATKLKQLTLEFIKDGQAKLITETEGWKKVSSVDLIKTIYEYIVEDSTDNDIK